MEFKVDPKDERKIGVYCIKNKINGKIYIGSTTTNFKHRYLQYKSGFKRKLDNQPVLYRAFRKHGFENFEFSIVCICSREDCIKMEQFYIDNGTDYNSCLIAGSLLGFKHNKNSKTRTIIKGLHHCAKKVDMYTLDGIYIQTFDSIISCREFLGIKSSSNISQCCLGNIYSIKGYRFSFNGKELVKRPKSKKTGFYTISKNDFSLTGSLLEIRDYFVKIGFEKCRPSTIHLSWKRGNKIYSHNIIKNG